MNVGYYMDVHVPLAVTEGLRLRSVDVLTAQEDGAGELSDPELLDRATALGRVLVSLDDDLIREAVRRQRAGEPFAGLISSHQLNITIGQFVRDLQLIAEVEEPGEIAGQVVRVPL